MDTESRERERRFEGAFIAPAVCNKLIQQSKQSWGTVNFWLFGGYHVCYFRNLAFLQKKKKRIDDVDDNDDDDNDDGNN